MSSFDVYKKKFIIAEQLLSNQGKMYFKDLEFNTYKEFEIYYKKNPDPHYYEIISGNQSLYFDFDCQENIPDVDFNELCEKILLKITEKYSIVINIYTSHSPTGKKYSYHVIGKGIFFTNHIFCGIVAKEIIANLKTGNLLKKYFDDTVYTSRRNFRMLNSRKIGSDRKKIFFGTIYKSKNYIHCQEENDLQMSLVSEIFGSDLYEVELGKNENDFLNKNMQEVLSWDEKKNKDVKKYLDENCRNQFTIGKIKKNFLSLERKIQGHCLACNRIHSSDNAYISLFNDKLYFVCWRNPKEKILIEDNSEKIRIKVIDDTSVVHIPEKKINDFSELKKFLDMDEFLFGF